MICTGCGQDNGDDRRLCSRCGRKLQSLFSVPDSLAEAMGGGSCPPDLDILRLEPGRLCRQTILRHLEAWAYAVLVLGALLIYGQTGAEWLLWLVVPALAGLAVLRRL